MDTNSQESLFEGFDNEINKVVRRLASHWYLFLLSVGICIGLAFIVNKFSTPEYKVQAQVFVDDEQAYTDPTELLFGTSMLGGGGDILNESIIIKSYPAISKTLKKLDFDREYYRTKNFKTFELYKSSPFRIISKKGQPFGPTGINFCLNFLDEGIIQVEGSGETGLSKEGFEYSGKHKVGDWIETKHGQFMVQVVDSSFVFSPDMDFSFILRDVERLALLYKDKLLVSQVEEKSSILKLEIKESIPKKGIEFLDALMELFISQNLVEKNQISQNTIKFINNELNEITDSLNRIERKMEAFKRDRNMSSISLEGENVMAKISAIEQERGAYVLRDKYYQYLKKTLEDPIKSQRLMSPEGFGVKAPPVIDQLTSELISLELERASLAAEGITKNPIINQLKSKILGIRQRLKENILSLEESNQIMLGDANDRLKLVEASARSLPGSEREFVNIQRMYSLSENLYLLLMNKKAEAEIAYSSNVPDFKVIEPAFIGIDNPVSPNKTVNYFLGIILGLFIPVLGILTYGFFDNKVHEKEMVEEVTGLPFLGSVTQAGRAGFSSIQTSPKSALAESFRNIRANLNFLNKNQGSQVYLFTSFVSGEGKTFCSAVLGSVLALGNKKTLLIGADLRKPRLHEELGIENGFGLTDYLVGSVTIDNIIRPTIMDNLDVILSGTIPPNPSELLMGDSFKSLLDELKTRYDYILLDCSPIGLVIDAYWLIEHANVSIFVLKQNYSTRQALESFKEMKATGKVKNAGFIFNGVRQGNIYGYGYGNSYGYYEEAVDESFWGKFKGFFSSSKKD